MSKRQEKQAQRDRERALDRAPLRSMFDRHNGLVRTGVNLNKRHAMSNFKPRLRDGKKPILATCHFTEAY